MHHMHGRLTVETSLARLYTHNIITLAADKFIELLIDITKSEYLPY